MDCPHNDLSPFSTAIVHVYFKEIIFDGGVVTSRKKPRQASSGYHFPLFGRPVFAIIIIICNLAFMFIILIFRNVTRQVINWVVTDGGWIATIHVVYPCIQICYIIHIQIRDKKIRRVSGTPMLVLLIFGRNIVTIKVETEWFSAWRFGAFVALLALAFNMWGFHGACIGWTRFAGRGPVGVRKRATCTVEAEAKAVIIRARVLAWLAVRALGGEAFVYIFDASLAIITYTVFNAVTPLWSRGGFHTSRAFQC